VPNELEASKSYRAQAEMAINLVCRNSSAAVSSELRRARLEISPPSRNVRVVLLRCAKFLKNMYACRAGSLLRSSEIHNDLDLTVQTSP
jgi:hypothetical protein